ncbi:hypothetical protein C2G38_2229964 [Gigaspora rosea]|uniref:Uncharacterized protein n=1 Tax=Gigaspora rosea TaxID=44941 RepID=A0A397TY17_9GLOM|nr:hypothetical protein C2G38_2229964 [Gigaspora rosea]
MQVTSLDLRNSNLGSKSKKILANAIYKNNNLAGALCKKCYIDSDRVLILLDQEEKKISVTTLQERKILADTLCKKTTLFFLEYNTN